MPIALSLQTNLPSQKMDTLESFLFYLFSMWKDFASKCIIMEVHLYVTWPERYSICRCVESWGGGGGGFFSPALKGVGGGGSEDGGRGEGVKKQWLILTMPQTKYLLRLVFPKWGEQTAAIPASANISSLPSLKPSIQHFLACYLSVIFDTLRDNKLLSFTCSY